MPPTYCLISDAPTFLGQVAEAMSAIAGPHHDGEWYLEVDDGSPFNMYPIGRFIPADAEIPFIVGRPQVRPPNLAKVEVFLIECRPTAFLVGVLHRLVAAVDCQMWLIDDDDVIWNCEDVGVHDLPNREGTRGQ